MPLDPPSREARALHLVGIIYEASIHPDSWAEFVRELSIEFGDAAVALSLEIPGLPLQRHAYRAHLDERFTFEFAKHLARDLPWGSLMQPQFTKGFARGSEFYANDQLPQTEFYKTWMRPQGLSPEGPIGHTIWKKDGKAMLGEKL